MNFTSIRSFWQAVALGGLLAAGAHASVLYNNLDQSDDGYDTLTWYDAAAQSFTTDGHAYRLWGATLLLSQAGEGDQWPVLGIYANAPGNDVGEPGEWLGDLTADFAVTGLRQEVDLFSSPGINLAPNTRYWAVLFIESGNALGWNYTDSDTGSGPGFDPNWLFYSESEAAWQGMSGSPYMMRLDADVVDAPEVPEPSTWLMLGGAMPLVLAVRRRRAR